MAQRSIWMGIVVLASGIGVGSSYAVDRLILGSKFQISNPTGGEDKRSVIGVGKESPTDIPSLSNPTTGGATLTVIANGDNSTSQSYILDASGWKAVSQGYKYRGPTGADGDPVKSVVFRRSPTGKLQLKIVIKGSVGTQEVKVFPPNLGTDGGFILDVVGGDRYCVAFGPGAGGSETRDSVLQWKIVNAVAEPGCPTLPTTTTLPGPTTTTTTPPNFSVLCPNDPTRTIFAGGPGTGACHQFDGDPVSCAKAFHLGGDGCGMSTCYYDFGSCNGCGSNNEQRGLCKNTCVDGPPSCPADPSRTIFAGYAQSSGCHNLDFSQELCERAFKLDENGEPASCFFDSAFGGQCLGCGPNNMNAGACQNTCPRCDGDASRTIFAGDPGSAGCHKFDGNQSSCEAAFVFGDSKTYNSCYYDSGSCNGCGPNNQASQACVDSCPVCAHDASRQIFVGGPNTSACDIFSNSPVLCEQSFIMPGSCGELTSCFFNYDDDRCEGCGPNNQSAGLCGNECAAPKCGDQKVNVAGEQCDGLDTGVCGPDSLCSVDCRCTACASAIIPAQGGTFIGTTSGASSLSTPNCGSGTNFAPEQVYQWTPATSGQAVITTCGGTTNFDTVVYIRSGSCRGPEITCNDDNCGVQSVIQPFVSAGVTYFIVVDGYGGDSGNFTLTVGFPTSPSGAFLDE